MFEDTQSGLTPVKYTSLYALVWRSSELGHERFKIAREPCWACERAHIHACAHILLFSPGHLTDQHLADFLRRCKQGLRPNGIIVIKDNMAQEGVILDDVDSSVCRDLDVVRRIIRSAGLSLLAEERQENLPDEIYHVYSFALR